ncbi:kinase-like domain-containing protein [Xylariaceae sp. FL1272]|nr:kinase-like domain-containing protein [Xylariaceae sp. FL1272]
MEILDQAEVFVENGDDFAFGYTSIILKQHGKIFYTQSPRRLQTNSEINLDEATFLELPVDSIWPNWNPKLIQAPQNLPPRTYVKKPSLLDFDPATSSKLGNQLLVEAEMCQILMAHPHPNIVVYLGCVVENGVIKGLCFKEYSVTLAQKLRGGEPIDIDHCIQGVERGVRHLHALGYIHNDLSPFNIMMDGDNPIIIDFDSSRRKGEELGWKRGTPGWTKEAMRYASPDNDFYSISKIREFMEKIMHK